MRATSWFVMVNVLLEPLLQAKEATTSTSCEWSTVPETAHMNGQPVLRQARCTVLRNKAAPVCSSCNFQGADVECITVFSSEENKA